MKKISHYSLFVLLFAFGLMFFLNPSDSQSSVTINSESEAIINKDTQYSSKFILNKTEKEEVLTINEASSISNNLSTVKAKTKSTAAAPATSTPRQTDTQVVASTDTTSTIVTASTIGCTSGTFNAQFLCLLNEYRRSKGLNSLVYTSSLNATAFDHATWMYQNSTMSHIGANGSRFWQRCADHGTICDAENVARGYRTASGLIEAWKKSPSHNANLIGSHKYIGLALVGSYSNLVMR
jgi:uncharacterized protein YkwD